MAVFKALFFERIPGGKEKATGSAATEATTTPQVTNGTTTSSTTTGNQQNVIPPTNSQHPSLTRPDSPSSPCREAAAATLKSTERQLRDPGSAPPKSASNGGLYPTETSGSTPTTSAPSSLSGKSSSFFQLQEFAYLNVSSNYCGILGFLS